MNPSVIAHFCLFLSDGAAESSAFHYSLGNLFHTDIKWAKNKLNTGLRATSTQTCKLRKVVTAVTAI